jgi:hypothetical protein
MAGVLYSSVLMDHANSSFTLLDPDTSYREYNFVSDCTTSSTNPCPSDYGSLQGRSRVPYVSGYNYGSMEHSSVYLYSSFAGSGIRTDATWNSAVNSNPDLTQVRLSLWHEISL